MGTGLMGFPSKLPPLTNAKPAVYRDNLTWLELVTSVRGKLDDLIDTFNDHATEEHGTYTAALVELAERFNGDFVHLRAYLESMVQGVNEEPLVVNPVDGTILQRITDIQGAIYDNARVYAYFAGQFDELEMTAEEYDNLDWTARHFDLAPLHPVLNDEWTPA